MRLMDAVQPSFARHETFHPRYGWFRKAYSFVAEDPQIFGREDAPVRVGVGKNMVRAIRFWGLAAKLIEIDRISPSLRSSRHRPTDLGTALLGEQGWDAYIEDPGTLWLLHWLLLAPPSQLPVWWLAFNNFHAVEFSEADLETAVTQQLEVGADWVMPHPSSIKKDIGALLRTYAPVAKAGRIAMDDALDCPLRELNLIGRSAALGAFRFRLGPKPTLPPAILGFATLDYIVRTNTKGNTATLNRLANEPGGPGRVFKLAEADLHASLEQIASEFSTLGLVVTTGAAQFTWSGEPRCLANDLLDRYYNAPDTDSPSAATGCQKQSHGRDGGQ